MRFLYFEQALGEWLQRDIQELERISHTLESTVTVEITTQGDELTHAHTQECAIDI